ncbi:MAG: hypothetical protein JRJ68_00765 [Deltaproteobacteria bacterium]|nr:hypothetical protein [Deltaproteobacteria bacterium]
MGFLVKYDKMRIFVVEERETKSINSSNGYGAGIEMSGKRCGFSKYTLKFMG